MLKTQSRTNPTPIFIDSKQGNSHFYRITIHNIKHSDLPLTLTVTKDILVKPLKGFILDPIQDNIIL